MALLILRSPYPDATAPTGPPLTNLLAWYKVDSLSASDGDPIGSWADSTGHGHTASQGNAPQQPIYHTGGPHGLPYLTFDGSNDVFTIPNATALNVAHLAFFCALKLAAVPYSGIMMSKENQYRLLASDVDSSHTSVRYASTNMAWGGSGAAGSGVLPTTWMQIGAIYGSTGWTFRRNSAGDGSYADTSPLVGDQGVQICLGAYISSGGFAMAMDFGELLMYDLSGGDLSGGDLAAIETYLGRWL